MKNLKKILFLCLLLLGIVPSQSFGVYYYYHHYSSYPYAAELTKEGAVGTVFCLSLVMGVFALGKCLSGLEQWKNRHKRVPITTQEKIDYLLEQQMDPEMQKHLQEARELDIKAEITAGVFFSILGSIGCIVSGRWLYNFYYDS